MLRAGRGFPKSPNPPGIPRPAPSLPLGDGLQPPRRSRSLSRDFSPFPGREKRPGGFGPLPLQAPPRLSLFIPDLDFFWEHEALPQPRRRGEEQRDPSLLPAHPKPPRIPKFPTPASLFAPRLVPPGRVLPFRASHAPGCDPSAPNPGNSRFSHRSRAEFSGHHLAAASAPGPARPINRRG